MKTHSKIASHFSPKESVVLYPGSCLELLEEIPDSTIQLVVTSPPYNLGKVYEKRLQLNAYLEQQTSIIRECFRVLTDTGSICWQVGNYVDNGEVVPLDILLYPIFKHLGMTLRNRIIWRFEHGLHCSRRLSGRYETILWFSKSDAYTFNLDPIRIPQKYPAKKYFKGPKAGQYSCNPLGKNPGDVWDIPNVKSNHVEKTTHPCQFPVELVERLVLAFSNEGDWVLDPFLGVATSIVAALRHKRKGAGAEILNDYVKIGKNRIFLALQGKLKTRPMARPIYDPFLPNGGQKKEVPFTGKVLPQLLLFDEKTACTERTLG